METATSLGGFPLTFLYSEGFQVLFSLLMENIFGTHSFRILKKFFQGLLFVPPVVHYSDNAMRLMSSSNIESRHLSMDFHFGFNEVLKGQRVFNPTHTDQLIVLQDFCK